MPAGRNRRSVWTIPTEPFPSAHFATFPQALVEPCILAGTSAKGVCVECGAPWERVVEKVETGETQKAADGWDTGSGAHGTIHRNGREAGETGKPVVRSVTTGWRPTCDHEADTVPAVVLDPFAGAGTVAMVARKLGRRSLGVELNPGYIEMARKRLEGVSLSMPLGV